MNSESSGRAAALPLSDRERNEAHGSGVSWAAVFAGAVATAALGLILLALGAGFELSSISPLSVRQYPIRHLEWPAIAWMVVAQIVAGGIGGYLAGRLRTRWTRIHTDEVHFRDTAHGFLAWAAATVASAAFLTTAGASLATGGASGFVAAEDSAYVASVVQPAPATAIVSVTDSAQRALQADAEARRVAARFLLWSFVAFLCGAFSASAMATVGGRQRDRVAIV
jgi:hypothetical protein